MNNKSVALRRMIALFSILILCVIISGVSLFSLQVVNGEEYREQAERRSTRSTTEYAARGEILDRYGRPLVTNEMAFALSLDYYTLEKKQQNEVIIYLTTICNEFGTPYNDNLPMTKVEPFAIDTLADEDDLEDFYEFLDDEDINRNLSGDELIDKLAEVFDAEDYTAAEKRVIVGVRYEMEQKLFSAMNPFELATELPIEMVTKIEESSRELTGISIDVKPIREYNTTYAAHILGRVGEIFAEDYAEYKEKGYPMNAIVGRDGIEKVFEEYLRGQDGLLSTETDGEGNEILSNTIRETVPGNNVMLTIDLALQQATEDSLATRIPELRAKSGTGSQAKGAAAVVLDVNTGEVLALASYPTYNLETFSKDFNMLNTDELTPMINRAIAGIYQPGSTYKIATSVAALSEGVISPTERISCRGIYTFYDDYQPRCWVFRDYGTTHGPVDVSGALQGSCNYYYYEMGRLMGGQTMEKYAEMLGLGEYTGIELLGEKRGNVAGPTSREGTGRAWSGGDSLQAAIGQSDHQFTPIQLANMVATVVNGGTNHGVTILKELKSWDFSETIEIEDSSESIDLGLSPEVVNAIKEGMSDVVNEGGTAASVFRDYPIAIGGKSGSAQTGKAGEDAHGLFVTFAPYDNPEIAICVVGENAGSGSNVAPVVRDILDAYFFENQNTEEILPTNYNEIP